MLISWAELVRCFQHWLNIVLSIQSSQKWLSALFVIILLQHKFTISTCLWINQGQRTTLIFCSSFKPSIFKIDKTIDNFPLFLTSFSEIIFFNYRCRGFVLFSSFIQINYFWSDPPYGYFELFIAQTFVSLSNFSYTSKVFKWKRSLVTLAFKAKAEYFLRKYSIPTPGGSVKYDQINNYHKKWIIVSLDRFLSSTSVPTAM